MLSQAYTTVNEGYGLGEDGDSGFLYATPSTTLIDLSKALLEAGRNEEAEVTANKAAALVRKSSEWKMSRGVYAPVFTGLVEVGKRAEALETARVVPDAESRSSAYLGIAEGLIKLRDADTAEESLARALEAARQMPENDDRGGALASVAQKLSVLNKSDKAVDIAEEALGIFIAERQEEAASMIIAYEAQVDDC